MKNYHTHTKRCNHAVGEDREYVLCAIEAGFEEIGFSDHAPMMFPKNYYSNFRMFPEQTDDYYNSIMSLKEEFKDKISIKFGFETEYYPEIFEKFLKFIEKYNYDYLILGQHFIGNEYDRGSFYSGNPTKDDKKLKIYVNQVIEAMKTGRFTYLAHPDLFNYTGDLNVYKEQMTKLVKAMKKMHFPLEFNGLGFKQGRNYPNKLFWEIVAKEKADVVIGLDAHNPKTYLDKTNYEKMINYLTSFGITPKENIELIKKYI